MAIKKYVYKLPYILRKMLQNRENYFNFEDYDPA